MMPNHTLRQTIDRAVRDMMHQAIDNGPDHKRLRGEAKSSEPLRRRVWCLFDMSSSMHTKETAAGSSQEAQQTWTRNDLAVQALKAIAQVMGKHNPRHQLAIQSFDSGTETIRQMLPAGAPGSPSQKTIASSLEKLDPDGATNLFSALQHVTRHANEGDIVIILTDGEVNAPFDRPSVIRKELDSLQRVANVTGERCCIPPMHTVGIGRYCDFQYLAHMSSTTGGRMSFVSGPNMIGEVIATLISNILEPRHDAEKILLPAPIQRFQTTLEDMMNNNLVEQKTANGGKKKIMKRPTSFTLTEHEISLLNASGVGKAFLRDMEPTTDNGGGQIALAMSSDDIFHDWGAAYLLQVLFCLSHQIPINNRDALSKCFSHKKQRDLAQIAETLFLTLEIDLNRLASIRRRKHGSSYVHYNAPPPVQPNFSSAQDAGYGGDDDCVEDGLVAMAAGQPPKQLSSLQRGDVLASGAIVECLVVSTGTHSFVFKVYNAVVTGWHPVMYNGKWTFACHCGEQITSTTLRRYHVLLKTGTTFIVNGLPCLALGAGIQNDPVASHDYFGDQNKVTHALQHLQGWDDGCVTSLGCIRGDDGRVTSHKY